MHNFNLAMLAKQVWGLLSATVFVCYSVKGEVLPGWMPSQSKTKSGSSFTWQSVLASLEYLKRAIFGERVMDRKLISGMIVGYQVAGI